MRLSPPVRLASSLAALCLAVAAPAGASTFDRVTFRDRITRAELIVQGVVTRIDHRNSDVAGPEHVRLPHTFVTVRIERLFKGTSADGDTITLRLEGGPDGQGRFLHVAGVPSFRVGDRDVLFIRRNGTSICPLVAWEQGRVRVIRGEVYDDFGNELWVTPDGDVAFGEPRIDVRSSTYPEVAPSSDPLENRPPVTAPVGSMRPDADGFAALLQSASAALASSPATDVPAASADVARAFYVKELRPTAPPADTAAPLAPSADDEEIRDAEDEDDGSNR